MKDTFSGVVLLADDEPSVRNVTKMALERLGFEVVAVENGQLAVDTFKERGHDFRLVLLDMTMPVVDGIEAFRQIIALDPNARVLLFSGFTEEDTSVDLTAEGLAGFLRKPFTISGLRDKIAEVLDC